MRWDLLAQHVHVPYIPTLGPVHPECLGQDILNDVLAASDSDEWLPYDIHARWGLPKRERIIADAIRQDETGTIIPVRRGKRIVFYCYGPRRPFQGSAETVTFAPSRAARPSGTRVQYCNIRTGLAYGGESTVTSLAECSSEVRASFGAFAERAGEGWPFLVRAGLDFGPVLVRVVNGQVAGAIGPMQIARDINGSRRLLPQYFAVLPEHRRAGYGLELWRAAFRWGQDQGADYQLLQTVVGGASDHLFQAAGLASLGTLHQNR